MMPTLTLRGDGSSYLILRKFKMSNPKLSLFYNSGIIFGEKAENLKKNC